MHYHVVPLLAWSIIAGEIVTPKVFFLGFVRGQRNAVDWWLTNVCRLR